MLSASSGVLSKMNRILGTRLIFIDFEISLLIMPENFERIFSLLEKIKTKGIEVYFIAGNHDFWIGKKFQSVITKSFLSEK